MATLEGNIPKLFLLKISRWLMLFMPTIFLFFTENGLSMTQIMVLQSAFGIAVAVLEVPSGYFSDVLGRKRTLILSGVFGVLGMASFAFGTGFWWFLLGEILLGISTSLNSGTDSALLYDSLQALDREDDYLKLEGKVGASGNFAEGIAAIIGGTLAHQFGLHSPYYGQILIALVGLYLAFTIVEPPVFFDKAKGNKSEVWGVIRWTFKEQKLLRWYIIASSFIGLTTLTCAWFAQPYFDFVEMPLWWYGGIWALLQFTVGVFSWNVKPIVDRLSRKTLSWTLVVTLTLSIFLLTQFQQLWAIVFIFIIYMVRGVAEPFFKTIINQLADPKFRATILSLRSLVIRFLFSTLGPILGWIMDVYTVQEAFLVSASILLIGGGLALLQLAKVTDKDVKLEEKPI